MCCRFSQFLQQNTLFYDGHAVTERYTYKTVYTAKHLSNVKDKINESRSFVHF